MYSARAVTLIISDTQIIFVAYLLHGGKKTDELSSRMTTRKAETLAKTFMM